mgnify:CR=1 FL=1
MGSEKSATASLGLSVFLLLQPYGEYSPDTFSDELSSSTLPDDHSNYTVRSYMGQDLDIERTLTPGEEGWVCQGSV